MEEGMIFNLVGETRLLISGWLVGAASNREYMPPKENAK